MGLIKYSAIVSGASGKIGGNVFARNASGAYARSWVKPVNTNTAKQQAVRTKFADTISAWRNIDPSNQAAWAAMAPQYPYTNRLGEASQYTGQQLFNHLNMNLAVVSATALIYPLVPQTFSSIGVTSLTMVDTAGVLTTADLVLSGVGLASESVIVDITPSMSGGITKPASGAFKTVTVVADASASATIDLIAAYQALFGDPELAAKVFVRAYLVNRNTGQRLNLGQAVAIISGT